MEMNGPCAVSITPKTSNTQRAADVNQQLHGADEIGARQEERTQPSAPKDRIK